jgi:hypothetical protein
MDEITDDATLRRKTLLAVITMGGGCALLLGLLGTGSWLIARASSDHTTTTASSSSPSGDGAFAPGATPSPTSHSNAPASPQSRKAPSSI